MTELVSANIPVSTAMEQRLAVIAAMRNQEAGPYRKRDWIATHAKDDSSQSSPTVDSSCRERMVGWCNNVVDFCGYSRETVEIALSYVDRFLATDSGDKARRCRMEFQLICMTSLYIAIKIHEETALDSKAFAGFGASSSMTREDIESTERRILIALRWRMNPPTSLGYARLLLELIPEDTVDRRLRNEVYELSQMQTEFVCSNYHFVSVPPSTIAYCAIMNSLDNLRMSAKALGYVGYFLALVLKIDCNSDHVIDVQSFLYPFVTLHMMGRGRRSRRADDSSPSLKEKNRREKSPESSPRSVGALF